MFSDGNIVGDGSWELRILVTDMNEEPKTLRVKGDLHIGGLMLQLVEDLGTRTTGKPFIGIQRKTKVVILMWTPQSVGVNGGHSSMKGMGNDIAPDECLRNCEFTSDREAFGEAHAVVFDDWSTTDMSDLPERSSENQLWVWLNQKPPGHSSGDLDVLSGLVNWTMTYRQDSDVYHPFGKVVPWNITSLANETEKEIDIDGLISKKSKAAVTVMSNCYADSKRDVLIKHLIKRNLSVDIFGRCGTPLPTCSQDAVNCSESQFWNDLGAKYKYYLAFENSVCADYVSDKFFQSLKLGMVPVVLGGADYRQIAPERSFIDVRSFPNVDEFVKFLVLVQNSNPVYKRFLDWKKTHKVLGGDGFCTLCKKVSDHISEPWNTSRVYYNLQDWWFSYPPKEDALPQAADARKLVNVGMVHVHSINACVRPSFRVKPKSTH